MLISIIIPFYDNDYNKIPHILNELKKLTFAKEVIFVDDRNDKTENINIPARYKLVRSHELFENVGTFEARRSGALNAIGDYLWFVDVDDELCNITKFPDTDEDISTYEFCYNYGNGKITKTYFLNYFGCTGMEIKNKYIINLLMDWTGSGLWNKLFKRETVLKTLENIPFLNKFINHEDGYLYFEILKNSKLTMFKLDHIYIYTNPHKHEQFMKQIKRENKLDEYIESRIPNNCPDREEYIQYMRRLV